MVLKKQYIITVNVLISLITYNLIKWRNNEYFNWTFQKALLHETKCQHAITQY